MRPVIPPRPVLSPAQQAAGKGLLNESNIGQTDGLLARLLARQEQRYTTRSLGTVKTQIELRTFGIQLCKMQSFFEIDRIRMKID